MTPSSSYFAAAEAVVEIEEKVNMDSVEKSLDILKNWTSSNSCEECPDFLKKHCKEGLIRRKKRQIEEKKFQGCTSQVGRLRQEIRKSPENEHGKLVLDWCRILNKAIAKALTAAGN